MWSPSPCSGLLGITWSHTDPATGGCIRISHELLWACRLCRILLLAREVTSTPPPAGAGGEATGTDIQGLLQISLTRHDCLVSIAQPLRAANELGGSTAPTSRAFENELGEQPPFWPWVPAGFTETGGGGAGGDWASYAAPPRQAFANELGGDTAPPSRARVNELGEQDPVKLWDPAGFSADGGSIAKCEWTSYCVPPLRAFASKPGGDTDPLARAPENGPGEQKPSGPWALASLIADGGGSAGGNPASYTSANTRERAWWLHDSTFANFRERARRMGPWLAQGSG
jgi:hypothetical protein